MVNTRREAPGVIDIKGGIVGMPLRDSVALLHTQTTEPIAVPGCPRPVDRSCRETPDVVHCLNGESYRVDETLGRGGLGGIYLARRFSDGLQVALKLTRRPHDQAAGHCLQRESEILRRFAHPNVVQVLDSGLTIDQEPYLVMEYVRGQSLERMVYSQSQLGLETSLRISIQLADALEHIHRREVVHRDMKPANVMVEEGSNRVVILDFGISEIKVENFNPAARVRYGTPLYMSPEQILDCTCTERSDVYQLGLVLFFCLSGELPFPTFNEEAIVRYKLGQGPTWKREQYPQIAPVQFLMESMLSRDPRSRLSSMRQVAAMLRHIQTGSEVVAVA